MVELKWTEAVPLGLARQLPLAESGDEFIDTRRVEMLRIYVDEGPEAVSFRLEGSLTGPWVAELEKCWHTATLSLPARSMTVKLTGVTFADDEGKELLCRMRRNGATLVATGCLMKAIVQTIEADICKPEGEAV
jgi:hypothetical protein